MRLHITALFAVLFASTAAVAQVATPQAVVLPTAPTPPAIVTSSPNENEAAAIATTNKVYIDQTGQNVEVNIEQSGTGNRVGTGLDKIVLSGDNQTVTAIQDGDNNQLYLTVTSGTGQTGLATITTQQIGDINYALIRCGDGNTTSCNQLDMNVRFTGNNNRFEFLGNGENIRNSMDVNGNNNEFYLDVDSPNATQTVLVTGDQNIFNVTQTGLGGTFGHSLYTNFTGSGNIVNTNQQGATETIINIQAVGSNGTYNITTVN